ncbi:MAG TPA: response regulator [Candidatus Dormibacteraeota bacterium]|nr:response regulator [Candidatus Dormibacteraeota bacterium]
MATVITVLVVDDDPAIRFLLRVILENEGYTVFEAGDGKAALAVIGTHVPDIVTTDLMMPVMTGAELIVRLRSEARTASIPIVVISSNPEAVRSLGVDATITKPFSAAHLADRVREVAGQSRRGQTV